MNDMKVSPSLNTIRLRSVGSLSICFTGTPLPTNSIDKILQLPNTSGTMGAYHVPCSCRVSVHMMCTTVLHSFSLFLSPYAHVSACLLSTVHSTLQPCAPLWLGWQGFRFTQLIISSTQARPTVGNTSCLSDQGHCTEDRGREKGQWMMDGVERKGKEKEVETDGQREIEGWAEGGGWRQREMAPTDTATGALVSPD
jgi:hypothetical protein